MRFSLIVATLGRTTELRHLLESLAVQTHRDFEVIVVDQNPDDRVAQILAPFASQIRIQRLVAQPGVSRARNLGLKAVSGDVVAFPDDDCWYPSSLLEQARNLFSRPENWDGVIGHLVDDAGKDAQAQQAQQLALMRGIESTWNNQSMMSAKNGFATEKKSTLG